MEEKKISETESLELITRMIRETQDNTTRNSAYPLLIWGYTTVIVSVIIWYLYLRTGLSQVNFFWVALPLVATPLTLIFQRKNQVKGTKNYIGRVIRQVWFVFGSVGIVLSCLAFFIYIDILFVIALLMSMGILLTGLISKYKPLTISGICGIILSLSMLFIKGNEVYLVFAAIFIVMMIIPGHIMNYQIRKHV